MQCRTCYMATLTPDEVARLVGQRAEHPIHMCPEHQASYDRLVSGIAHLMVKAPRPSDLKFPEASDSEE